MDDEADYHHERWSWRDIEVLPVYILAAIVAFLIANYVAERGDAGVRDLGLKAALIVGMIGYRQIWTEGEDGQ